MKTNFGFGANQSPNDTKKSDDDTVSEGDLKATANANNEAK